MSWDYIYKKDGDPRYHYKRNRPPDANEQRVKELYNELGKSEFLKLVSDLWEHQGRFGLVMMEQDTVNTVLTHIHLFLHLFTENIVYFVTTKRSRYL